MKNSSLLTALILLVLALSSCTDQTETAVAPKTKLTFSFLSPAQTNGRQTNSLSEVRKISISVTTSTGDEVFTHHEINVTPFGDGFISDAVEFNAGHFILKDFFLLGDSSEVLFATPHRGSFLGSLPKQPLDRDFSVAMNKVNTMAMEVIDVDGLSPEDFGYTSFSLEALKLFPVAVKIIKDGKSQFTTAEGYLLHGTDSIGSFTLGTAPTMIKFASDPDAQYELVVIKDGYARYSKSFKYQDLINELNHKPLLINLDPAFTVRLIGVADYDGDQSVNFKCITAGLPDVTVNWGDGNIEVIKSMLYSEDDSTGGQMDFYHEFPSDSSNYFISITGGIGQILDYQTFYHDFRIAPVNVDALPNLASLNLSLFNVESLIDLQRNQNLLAVSLNCDGVILPKVNHLTFVRIPQRMENYLDYIIKNVYTNAVAHNTTNGEIDFSSDWYGYDPNNPSGPIKVPSSYSKFLLKELRDKYHWKIYPLLGTY